MKPLLFVAALAAAAPLFAQELAPSTTWEFKTRVELRANYRDSKAENLQLRFPFPPSFLPVGQTAGFLQTVDPGSHFELSVAQLQLEARYGDYFLARAQVHGVDKYRRNPTSGDRRVDADEIFVRLGPRYEFLDRPQRSTAFVQAGKFPKVERQPVRLLESYGLAATSFNRFEDVGVLAGGTFGRSLYWRASATTGNPLFFRDPNALAGDNGIKELLRPNPDPRFKSGFPILYNAETEGYFLRTDHVQYGQALGYRWQDAAETAGFDAIVFHYRRDLADREQLAGTFYGGDLDLLNGPEDREGRPLFPVPTSGRRKEETGIRIYGEWRGLSGTAQFTKQAVAGLHREGFEIETGYRLPFAHGPAIGGETLMQSVQPVVRLSTLKNRFTVPREFVAPSIRWPWVKFDYGVRIAFAKNVDLTLERAHHNIVAAKKLDLDETLVTVRIRLEKM